MKPVRFQLLGAPGDVHQLLDAYVGVQHVLDNLCDLQLFDETLGPAFVADGVQQLFNARFGVQYLLDKTGRVQQLWSGPVGVQ